MKVKVKTVRSPSSLFNLNKFSGKEPPNLSVETGEVNTLSNGGKKRRKTKKKDKKIY